MLYLTEATACAACLCVVLCLYFHVGERRKYQDGGRWMFGVTVSCFFFLFGIWRSASVWREVGDGLWDGERTFHAVLADVPRLSERAVRAEAWAAPCDDSGRLCKVALTFLRDSLSEVLGVGSSVVCKAELRRPENRENAGRFDYAEYLAVKGISGQAFLVSGRWRPVVSDKHATINLPWMVVLRVRALVWRDRLLSFYQRAGLEGEVYALLSALTLGEKSRLSHELRHLYSETGVSHILALSGMHLGFLMMFFHFLFVRCGRHRGLQMFVGVFSLFLMWIYVFVAGLPASLVRAGTMYTLMWVAVLLGRKGISVNALTVSAFIMLCIRPSYLYDVGFRLSFLAMTGILTVYPAGKNLKVMQCRAGWFFRTVWFSFSAQLLTLPLSIYCFGMFSPYSVWATLVVSPLTALLLACMPLLLVIGCLGTFPADVLVSGVEWIVRLQNLFLKSVSLLPFSSVDMDISFFTMSFVYVLLAVVLLRRCFSYVLWLKILCSLLLLFMLGRLLFL